MIEPPHAAVEAVRRAASENLPDRLPAPVDPPGVHHTELPEAKPGDVFFHEWNVYRRDVGRWLAEGQGGRYVLIKGQEVLGFHDTWDAARQTGLKRFLLEPFFVHAVREAEPFLRVRGVNLPWPS